MFESNAPAYASCTPMELKEMLATRDVQLLDVREVWEFSYCRIPGSINIPLSLLPLRYQDLDPSRTTVVICHHGSRSYFACLYLEKQGFETPINLTGGIDAWSRIVDHTFPTY